MNTVIELTWRYPAPLVKSGLAAFVGDDEANVQGVYVVRSSQKPDLTIRVGSGIIANRLSDHRNSFRIRKYDPLEYVWAPVAKKYLWSVERFLGDTLSPIVADRFPDVLPIAVNLPSLRHNELRNLQNRR